VPAPRDRVPSNAIVPWRLLRRPALGDSELVGKAGCASSLESESIFGKRSRTSEGLPSGACRPALVRLTPGGVGFCNRRGRSGSLVRAGSPAPEIAQMQSSPRRFRSAPGAVISPGRPAWLLPAGRGSLGLVAALATMQKRWSPPSILSPAWAVRRQTLFVGVAPGAAANRPSEEPGE
jgi:hypothetical protein